MTGRVLPQILAAGIGFLQSVYHVTNVETLLWRKDLNCLVSATWPEWLRKDWWGESCWLHPRETGPEVDQGPGGVITSPTWLDPVLEEPVKLSEVAENVRYIESSQGCCPETFPWRKRVVRINAVTLLYHSIFFKTNGNKQPQMLFPQNETQRNKEQQFFSIKFYLLQTKFIQHILFNMISLGKR